MLAGNTKTSGSFGRPRKVKFHSDPNLPRFAFVALRMWAKVIRSMLGQSNRVRHTCTRKLEYLDKPTEFQVGELPDQGYVARRHYFYNPLENFLIERSLSNELILIPVLKAHRGPNGGLVLTQKYLDGAVEYAKHWDGPVTTLAEVSQTPSTDTDHVEVLEDCDTQYRIEERPKTLDTLIPRLQNVGAVVGFLDPSQSEMTRQCSQRGIPVIHVCEYTLKTEFQIIDASPVNPLVKLRRKVWIRNAERTRRALLGSLAGLQCNGVPVFEAYKPECPDAFLFFDNRVRKADVASDQDLERRAARLKKGERLRLLFGGRFVPMKGTRFLPLVAQALAKKCVDFQFDIYGSGPERGQLVDAVRRLKLEDRVKVHPPVDFLSEWVPLLKNAPDLFVSCHPQGDPSSTYSEVMSCGLPIVGFANEAFEGIVAHSRSGFLTPLGDAEKLADQIAKLDQNREVLTQAARRGRDFMRSHCFEETFARRTAHFSKAAEAWRHN